MLGTLPTDCIKVTGAGIEEVNGFYQPLSKLHMGHRRWKHSSNDDILLRRGDEGNEWQWVIAKAKYDFDLKKEVASSLYTLEASNRIERMPRLTGWVAVAPSDEKDKEEKKKDSKKDSKDSGIPELSVVNLPHERIKIEFDNSSDDPDASANQRWNGMYLPSGEMCGRRRWEHEDGWKKQSMYWGGDKNPNWLLCEKSYDTKKEAWKELFFFLAPTNTEDERMPPATGWIAPHKADVDAPMTITFIAPEVSCVCVCQRFGRQILLESSIHPLIHPSIQPSIRERI